MAKKITASRQKQETGFCYEAPWQIGRRTGKSFILTRSSLLLYLPVRLCPVQDVEEGKVEIEVPDWLYEKNRSFFES